MKSKTEVAVCFLSALLLVSQSIMNVRSQTAAESVLEENLTISLSSDWTSVGVFAEFDMRHESYLHSIGAVHSKINWRIEAIEDTALTLNVTAYQTSVEGDSSPLIGNPEFGPPPSQPPLIYTKKVAGDHGNYMLYNQYIIVNATDLEKVKSIEFYGDTFQVSEQVVLNTTLGLVEGFELKNTEIIDFSLRVETTLLVSKSTGIVIRQLIQFLDADSGSLGAEREYNISRTNVDIPLWSPPPFDFLKSYPWLPIVAIVVSLVLITIVLWKKRPFKKRAPT